MLLLLQYAALGQRGLCFQPELHDVNDSAREDTQCCINGEPLEPSDIEASEFYPTTEDPDGIHSNKAGLSKVRHVPQVASSAWCWHVCKAKHQYPKLSHFWRQVFNICITQCFKLQPLNEKLVCSRDIVAVA